MFSVAPRRSLRGNEPLFCVNDDFQTISHFRACQQCGRRLYRALHHRDRRGDGACVEPCFRRPNRQRCGAADGGLPGPHQLGSATGRFAFHCGPHDHDALVAGFNKVVFIIRKDIEEEFKQVIGNRIEKITQVEYVYQDIQDLPEGFTCPKERTKPWGTGHAVLAAKKVINEPFVVINADDYYGKEAFVKIHEYLVEDREKTDKMDICMAGFILENTLSDNGGVTRGICALDEQKNLIGITETYNIQKTENGPAAVEEETGEKTALDEKTLVSMNMWGLPVSFLNELEKGFPEFLDSLKPGDIKAEYLLPKIIDKLVHEGKAKVRVLDTPDKWFGVPISLLFQSGI